MAKYCTNPDIVDAVQVIAADFNGSSFDGSPFSETPKWLMDAVNEGRIKQAREDLDYAVWDVAEEVAAVRAEPGDWIVYHGNGGLRVLGPDQFDATYQPLYPQAEAARRQERAQNRT